MDASAVTRNAEAAIALYVHWPFCLSRCPYCDFNAHVRERIDQGSYARAILRELAFEAERLGRRPLGSIFFGGGTPSLMEPGTASRVIEAAKAAFEAEGGIEITLEANPTSIEIARLRAFREAGVNRVSVGVQALDDAALRFLGREHDSGQARRALETAVAVFPRSSFDLICARPGQSVAAWRAELAEALAYGTEHLSLYQLTIEPGTAFAARHARGELVLPEDDAAAELYDATVETAARAGLGAYEVSNFARPGAESRHNLAYWRYGDYCGIGPGAHGRVSLDGVIHATRKRRAPEAWMEAVERSGHGEQECEALAQGDAAREMLLMGLRLAEGMEEAALARRTGVSFDDAVDRAVLEAAEEEGYLRREAGRVVATTRGRMVLDALLGRLVR